MSNGSCVFVHDYLLQRGGAERVVQALNFVREDAPIYTFAYNPDSTFSSFRNAKVKTFMPTDLFSKSKILLSLSILGSSSFFELPESELTIFSSSGWSHFIQPVSRSVLYMHTPARWLYATKDLEMDSFILKKFGKRGMSVFRDLDKYRVSRHKTIVANSKVTQSRIHRAYNLTVPIIHPPVYISTNTLSPVPAIEHDFVLHVGRTRSYKNHEFVEEIASLCPEILFVFVGYPLHSRRLPNCIYLSNLSDEEIYWLYSKAKMLIAVAEEDFGLTPLEAAAFGTPTLARASGGYLESVKDGVTGWLLDSLNASIFARKIKNIFLANDLDEMEIKEHSKIFSPKNFYESLKDIGLSENS